MPTCVIVAGTYRSGTSLLARFLHESGCDMNPVNNEVSAWNPTGSYKEATIDTPSFSGWDNYFQKRNVGVWGIKSHNFMFNPLLFGSFMDSCPSERKVLVFTKRDEVSAGKSFKALRDDISLEEAMHIIWKQTFTIQAIYDSWPPEDRIEIEFPSTAFDPESQLKSVADLIGLNFNKEAMAHISADIPRWG